MVEKNADTALNKPCFIAGSFDNRSAMDRKFNLGLALTQDEEGFMETYILAVFLVFSLTFFAFLLGTGMGMQKNAQARYSWFTEALDFATRAANRTGSTLGEVRLNEDTARTYFTAAMNEMRSYNLQEFRTVAPGTAVPGGIASGPGYLARVKVPVFEAKVPLVGRQRVEIPMSYFSVVQSQSQQN